MKVELLTHFGSDKMVCDVARVSYNKIKQNFDDKDVKLIKYLVEHGHTSPFRHPQLQFRIQCAIFVERQLFKHQVGWTANSISGRYVDFSDSYDLPTQLRYQSKSSKQGSGEDLPADLNCVLYAEMHALVQASKILYNKLAKAGVAKEQCRVILPLCLETNFIWTGSIQAFVHLCNLRLKKDAQKETRLVTQSMLEQVKAIKGNPFQHTIAAFGL
jgi:thymidylate synthase (FAD)